MVLVATQVKRRRGTTAENDAFTGAEGEITVDLENKELRVHTGDNKVGGYGLARKDFENITDDAKNTANWSSNVSNCITNIPQDIKLELNNGILTLKAGSKVYVPNGAGVFDEFVVPNDISTDFSWASDVRTVVLTNDKTALASQNTQDECFSGSTAPSGHTYMLWYDTSNNLLKRTENSGSSWFSGDSLPICIINGHSSIDQVFNGFGYIGSTVFALPKVKGLIPNGKNTDGSLKSIEMEITNVQTNTYITDNYSGIYAGITPSGTIDLNGQRIYNESENFIYNGSDLQLMCEFAVYTNPSGKIANFTPKTVFHAVDYNDTEFIIHQTMPDYTAGVSKSINVNYTETKNGYLVITPSLQSANSEINIEIAGQSFQFWQGFEGVDYNHLNIGVFPIPRNVTYTITRWQNVNVKFFPCIGG